MTSNETERQKRNLDQNTKQPENQAKIEPNKLSQFEPNRNKNLTNAMLT
jgi:hypothetical protein